jgi:hypothetical protein
VDLNGDFFLFFKVSEVAVTFLGKFVANILVHAELIRSVLLNLKPILPLWIAPGAEHSSEMLECLLEALLFGFGEIDEMLLDVAHTSLDVKLDGMDLLGGVLDVDLLLGELEVYFFQFSFSFSSSSLGFIGFG